MNALSAKNPLLPILMACLLYAPVFGSDDFYYPSRSVEFYGSQAREIEDFRKSAGTSPQDAVGEKGFMNWVVASTYGLSYSEYLELVAAWSRLFHHQVPSPVIS